MPKYESVFMERALALAQRGLGHTRPNPPVGAVVVKGGKIIGEGWHRKAGGDHAEVAAIKNARRRAGRDAAGDLFKGTTLYVTLEPCSKPGRVGACTDAIVASGIPRVVYAVPDPNPKNRGKAKRVLEAAGVKCECWANDRAVKNATSSYNELILRRDTLKWAREIIVPFAKHVMTGMPYVTVKIAMSLDGRICDDKGEARWVSSEKSRRRTGRMREVVDAIMVGAETVRRDDPSLLSHGRPNPDLIRVVISRSGRLPKKAQVFTDGKNETLVFDDAEKALAELGKAGVTHVLCEGGLNLARSLSDAGLVDEWVSVLAPIVIGSRAISQARRFSMCRIVEHHGGDMICSCSRRLPVWQLPYG